MEKINAFQELDNNHSTTAPLSKLSSRYKHSDRFLQQQARDTQPTRYFLYSQVSRTPFTWILDLGCGSGFLSKELQNYFHTSVIGLDNDVETFQHNASSPLIHRVLGDAHALPFRRSSASHVYCQFTLLWVHSPSDVLNEIYILLKPTGIFYGLEPSYQGRIEHPPPPSTSYPIVRTLQTLGAHPNIGSTLSTLLPTAGFQIHYYAVLAWEYDHNANLAAIQSEQILIHKISPKLPLSSLSFVYTPVFSFIAQKPSLS